MVENLTELNKRYQKIKEQCIVRFFSSAGESEAEVFPWINNLCQRFMTYALKLSNGQDSYNVGMSLQNKYDAIKKSYVQSFDVDGAIQNACSVFWEFRNECDLFFKEDKYLNSHERTYLRDWKEGTNPYSGLQKLYDDYRQDAITIEDVLFLFNNLLLALEENLTSKEMTSYVNFLLKGYSFSKRISQL